MNEESRPFSPTGDRLFKGDLDIDLNADISHWNKDLHAYAEGYRDAADLVVEGVLDNPQDLSSRVSYLVFAVVFLYRQYLELRLKEIILLGSQLYSPQPQGFPRHHKIAELWSHARPFLERLAPNGPHDDLDAVEACVNEFSALDPKGIAFRYPVDLTGNRTLSQDWMVINLRHLALTMSKIANLLDDSSEAILVLWQQAQRKI